MLRPLFCKSLRDIILLGLSEELAAVEIGVEAVLRHQLFVRTGLDDVAVAARLNIPILKNKCPHDHEGQRKQTKAFLSDLEKTQFPEARERILGAMRRDHISGW